MFQKIEFTQCEYLNVFSKYVMFTKSKTIFTLKNKYMTWFFYVKDTEKKLWKEIFLKINSTWKSIIWHVFHFGTFNVDQGKDYGILGSVF